MLILSRRVGEEIVIGPPGNPIARVVVVEIRGAKVTVGIAAEASVEINRGERLEERERAA